MIPITYDIPNKGMKNKNILTVGTQRESQKAQHTWDKKSTQHMLRWAPPGGLLQVLKNDFTTPGHNDVTKNDIINIISSSCRAVGRLIWWSIPSGLFEVFNL